jgi:hypothetical protein
VATGVSFSEWLTDPVAMITAAAVLDDIAQRTKG